MFLTLAQAKLRAQVEELAGKMNSRLDEVDPAFKKIADALPKAAAEMKTAEGNLKGLQAKEALTPEQRALKLLQDAEQEYEVQVSQQRGGGGGGGGGQQHAEDLADLFQLEAGQAREPVRDAAAAPTSSRATSRSTSSPNKLKELAKRAAAGSRAAAPRMRRSGGSRRRRAPTTSVSSPQQLEEAARQLEQLSRDQPRAELWPTPRGSCAMRRTRCGRRRRTDRATAARRPPSALQKLREAQQKLTQNQSGRGDRDMQQAKQ